MDALEGNMETVSTKKADIGDQAEQEQGRPEKKREVDLWMERAVSLEDQVHELRRKVKEGISFCRVNLDLFHPKDSSRVRLFLTLIK